MTDGVAAGGRRLAHSTCWQSVAFPADWPVGEGYSAGAGDGCIND
ncbi:hypothetical protein ECP03047778_5265 [Escherichia coli P0304777.8]|nr:hypothetical protein ECP03047778_5265 [Escherichia coli P0304777.8]